MKLNRKKPAVGLIFFLILTCFCYVSCEDDYIYDDPDKKPEGLYSSVYDYMKEAGNFTYFVRIIEDLGYKEILSRTGSKTLFPAQDDAFRRFFESDNEYGVSSYEELSIAQKRSLLNGSMLNMSYVAGALSNASSSDLREGRSIRKQSDNTFLDSVAFLSKFSTQLTANDYWKRFQSKGLYLVDDETSRYNVFFTPANRQRGITEEDFAIISNNATYQKNAYYVNGIRIIKPDVICNNGYIHVVEELLLPVKNLDQTIRDNGNTQLFSHLLNKFSAPYFYQDISKQVMDYYNGSTPLRPLLPDVDSVFVKRYFTDARTTGPYGKDDLVGDYGVLYFDPAEYSYSGDEDMGVMFVPSDEAMDQYFNGPRGQFLKDTYGSWDNIPTSILALFLKNHQKKSFLNSLPHAWPAMNDEASFAMNVKKADIKKAHIASNGIVYVTHAVYPPVDYQCVYASTLISNNTKIMNWAIQQKTMKYYLYLRSMENMYNLIIPTDEAFHNYRDPLSWGIWANNPTATTAAGREIWDFYYSSLYNMVFANIYNVDASGEKGSLKNTYTTNVSHQQWIENRLNDIIDMHIVIGYKNKASGAMSGYIDDGVGEYALSKSGATLKINGSGIGATFTGGGDIEINEVPAKIEVAYNSDNGKTFFINKIIQDPFKSVYQVLKEQDEYQAFFKLLTGDRAGIFSNRRASGSDIGGLTPYLINSFNNFRYTIFVPTKAALDAVFAGNKESRDLWTWEEITSINTSLPNYAQLRDEKTTLLTEFLKYHFMDNSVYIDGKSLSATYETSARYESQYGGGKFRKITVNSNGTNLNIIGGNDQTAQVLKTNNSEGKPLYNLMARDYIVKYEKRDGNEFPSSIESSSRVVIHLIDKALRYE